jgi:hypothetical protein
LHILSTPLESDEVIVVEIDMPFFILDNEQPQHLFRYEFRSSFEIGKGLVAWDFTDNVRKAVVDEYQLVEGWAKHDVGWVDVPVHDVLLMEGHQAAQQVIVIFLSPVGYLETLFHREFDPAVEH